MNELMTHIRRSASFVLILFVIALWGSACVLPAAALDDPPTIREWSEGVWHAAKDGDEQALADLLAISPIGEGARVDHVRAGLSRYKANLANAAEARAASRTEALESIEEHIENGNIIEALGSAVEYQTLSSDLEGVLAEPQIRDVIHLAKRELPQAESNGDWLVAQQLVYRLRTLYDDTARRAEYNEYDRELKRVNRRISLLAEYAPEHLHSLRDTLLQRLGEEPLPEFNPGGMEDWRERREGINNRMLETGMKVTAAYHIESTGNDGWRPLLNGGLEAVRLLATTSALAETFPGLKDDQARDRWVEFCEREKNVLQQTHDHRLSSRYFDNILRDLEALNRETIQLPDEVLYHEFGDGAMYELSISKEDDYTEIIWPNELRRFQQSTVGRFVGVGILISYNDKREITVVNPLEGTPAFRAGVHPDDVIIQVDETSTVGWSLNDAVDKITGKEGSKVTLGIRREGEGDTLYFDIIREEIPIRSVKGWHKTGLGEDGEPDWDWFIDPVNRIGYVRLTGFSDETYGNLVNAWNEMKNSGEINGLILDLRHNPGGLLDSARDIANLFLSEGVVVSIEGKMRNDRETLTAREHRAAIAREDVPVVVLVNKGSASASEIVAGALQAHGAAVVVGTRTWGKGSVQRVYRLSPDAQIKVTTQYYRLPPAEGEEIGRLVHKRPNAETWGVDPDVHVDMTPEQVVDARDVRESADAISNEQVLDEDGNPVLRPDPMELIAKGIDPQLETALLILQARALRLAMHGDRASVK